MPPIDYNKYPTNWKTEIRPAILTRAGYNCEECGLASGAEGVRDDTGEFRHMVDKENDAFKTEKGYYVDAVGFVGNGLGSKRLKVIKIVLTIAHLNNDITDNRPENLKALCQRCHLLLDKELHQRNAKATRDRNKGLQSMFP